MNPRRWLHEHSLKLLAIRDTPEAIAGGVAIGIFIGFTPLFGLKTVLTILFAWLTRSNILAAVIASAAHDILLPLMPVIFRWEYDVGFWLLSQPHHLPPRLSRIIGRGTPGETGQPSSRSANLCWSGRSCAPLRSPSSPTCSQRGWWPGTNARSARASLQPPETRARRPEGSRLQVEGRGLEIRASPHKRAAALLSALDRAL